MLAQEQRYDPKILDYIPHRPPMLLINRIVDVGEKSSRALVFIDSDASFYEHCLGVPSWIAIEYMGQTAALIGGYQLENNLREPSLGFLLGTRSYKAYSDYFADQSTLLVSCTEKDTVGDNFATFDCKVYDRDSETLFAEAVLSVYSQILILDSSLGHS